MLIKVRRKGVTLIELLVVIGIIVLIAGVTLPSFREMMKGQKIGQGSQVVLGMIESVRSRAIATGRPVAVVFERIPVDTTSNPTFNHALDNTVLRLAVGEVFPPYEGDWSGSTGRLVDSGDADLYPDQLVIDFAKVASLYDINNPGQLTGLANVGDLLQLSDHSQLFSIIGISLDTSNAADPEVHIAFQNPPPNFNEPLWATANSEVRFRIYRRPTKSLAGSVVLPRGICVDLSESGLGPTGNGFMVAPRPAVSFPDRYGSLYLVFNSRGSVDGLFYREHLSAVYTFVDVNTTSLIHFLVGKAEQVIPGGLAPPIGEDRNVTISNLYDPSNYWISINPSSGSAYSTSNAAIDPSLLPPPRAQARQMATTARTGREL